MLAAKDRLSQAVAAPRRPVTFAAPARISGNLLQEPQRRPFVFNRLQTLWPPQNLQPVHFQSPTHSLTHAKDITSAFPVTSALFLRFFSQEGKSTPLLSIACALFCRSVGGGAKFQPPVGLFRIFTNSCPTSPAVRGAFPGCTPLRPQGATVWVRILGLKARLESL
jgi:hypothetical protein